VAKLSLLTDPVDQALLRAAVVASYRSCSMSSATSRPLFREIPHRASVGCASYSRGFIEPAANFGQ